MDNDMVLAESCEFTKIQNKEDRIEDLLVGEEDSVKPFEVVTVVGS
jgi:hypothetical protein